MRSLLSFACLAFALVLAGCSTPPEQRLDSPGLAVASLTASDDSTTLTLRFTNSNTVPLVVTRSTHTLYLGGKRIGRIDDREPIGIPAVGGIAHTVTLPKALAAAVRALIKNALRGLALSPFSYRKASPSNPFLRELIIPFGSAGYVALFEIDDPETVTVLAVRHHREDDYH